MAEHWLVMETDGEGARAPYVPDSRVPADICPKHISPQTN